MLLFAVVAIGGTIVAVALVVRAIWSAIASRFRS
jgi:hypothetical protein